MAAIAEASAGLEAKLDGILARHDELGRMMAAASGEAYVALAKEHAELRAESPGGSKSLSRASAPDTPSSRRPWPERRPTRR